MSSRRALAILGALALVDELGAGVVLWPGFVRELAAAGLLRRGSIELDRLRALAFRP